MGKRGRPNQKDGSVLLTHDTRWVERGKIFKKPKKERPFYEPNPEIPTLLNGIRMIDLYWAQPKEKEGRQGNFSYILGRKSGSFATTVGTHLHNPGVRGLNWLLDDRTSVSRDGSLPVSGSLSLAKSFMTRRRGTPKGPGRLPDTTHSPRYREK